MIRIYKDEIEDLLKVAAEITKLASGNVKIACSYAEKLLKENKLKEAAKRYKEINKNNLPAIVSNIGVLSKGLCERLNAFKSNQSLNLKPQKSKTISKKASKEASKNYAYKQYANELSAAEDLYKRSTELLNWFKNNCNENSCIFENDVKNVSRYNEVMKTLDSFIEPLKADYLNYLKTFRHTEQSKTLNDLIKTTAQYKLALKQYLKAQTDYNKDPSDTTLINEKYGKLYKKYNSLLGSIEIFKDYVKPSESLKKVVERG